MARFDLFGQHLPIVIADPKPQGRALRAAGKLIIIAFVLVLSALIFVPWQQSLRGEGRVIAYAPVERQQDIKVPIAGRVVAWSVQEGQHVEEGDLIATISDNDPSLAERLGRSRDAALDRLETARQTARVFEQQILSLETARSAAVAAAADRIEMSRSRVVALQQTLDAAIATQRAAELQLTRTRALANDGLTSTRNLELAELAVQTGAAEIERARATHVAAQSEVQSMRAEKTRTEATMSAELERARASLQQARAEYATTEALLQEREIAVSRQETMKIVAPRAGWILRQIAKQNGEYVSAGDSIAILVPTTDARAVELWLDGRDGPLATAGRHVRLQFEGWPAVQFVGWPSVAVGTFGGTIAFVDSAADERGRFRVVVVPDLTDEPWPSTSQLRQGVRANGWILLDRVKLGFELWRQWNGFPPATKTPATDAPTKPAPGKGTK